MVIVRAFGDEPVRRMLLSYTSKAAFVCGEENYRAIVSGERASPMIGFPLVDVFEDDDDAAKKIAAGAAVDWSSLRPIQKAA